jgi:hypothetical protein
MLQVATVAKLAFRQDEIYRREIDLLTTRINANYRFSERCRGLKGFPMFGGERYDPPTVCFQRHMLIT